MRYGVYAPIAQYSSGVRKWTAGRIMPARAVVLHRMEGTLEGSDSWLRGSASGSASTHFGIGTWNGGIQTRQWVDTVNSAYGWAANPTDRPTPLALNVFSGMLYPVSWWPYYLSRYDLNYAAIHVEIEGWAYQPWNSRFTAPLQNLLAAIARVHGPLRLVAHTDLSSKPCPGVSHIPWSLFGGYGGRIGNTTLPSTSVPAPSTSIPRADGAPVRFRSIEQVHMTLKPGKPIRDGASINAATIATTSKPTRVRVVGYMNTGSYDPWYIYAVYRGNGDSFAYSPKIDFE